MKKSTALKIKKIIILLLFFIFESNYKKEVKLQFMFGTAGWAGGQRRTPFLPGFDARRWILFFFSFLSLSSQQ